MKTILYHGTTRKAASSILKNGWDISYGIWNCSGYGGDVFFWDLEALAESNCEEDEDFETKEDRVIQQAFESAQIAAAVKGQQESELVVLKVEVSTEDIELDQSCENMDAARCVNTDDLNNTATILETIVCEGYQPELRFFILSGVFDDSRTESVQYPDNWSDSKQRAFETVKGAEVYPEDIYCFEDITRTVIETA